MALNFLPFKDGQVLTTTDLNDLVDAIRNGTIFDQSSIVGDLVSSLGGRVTILETKVAILEAQLKLKSLREQAEATLNQASINLSKTPALDSELVYQNGLLLSRDDEPAGVSGDYTISGSIIIFTPARVLEIEAGDRLTVVYQFEVGT
jgi:hypothetical protein